MPFPFADFVGGVPSLREAVMAKGETSRVRAPAYKKPDGAKLFRLGSLSGGISPDSSAGGKSA
jgi:hypothetical protein